jgi:hypothetical protein
MQKLYRLASALLIPRLFTDWTFYQTLTGLEIAGC